MSRSDEPMLLPEPQHIIRGEGSLVIPRRAGILTSGLCQKHDPAIWESLKELFPGNRIRNSRSPASGKVLFITMVPDGQAELNGLDWRRLGTEGYFLKASQHSLVVAANTGRGIYYGLTTLRQCLYRRGKQCLVPVMEITDYPVLKIRAVMLDLGRQAIRTSYLLELMKELSQYKLNQVCLYVEDKVKYPRHPKIAHPQAYSKSDLQKIIRWGTKYHMEVVPGVASLGHAENYLKHKPYQRLAEGGSIYQLNPTHPGTKRLIQDMYRFWLGIMETGYFNICCDESPHLGEDPKNRDLAGRIGKDGIFARYVTQLHDFLKKHGKKTMMWGDMLLHYPRLKTLLPKDIIILDWDYGDFRKRDRHSTEEFRKMGYPVIACPAATTAGELGNTAYFRYQWNIPLFIQKKYQYGLEGVLVCLWEVFTNFIENAWPGLGAGAEYAWNLDKVPIPAFKEKFARHFYGSGSEAVMDAFRLLDGEQFHARKRPLEPDYHEGVEFTNSHPFVFLKYEEHPWPQMMEKRSQAALNILRRVRPGIKKHRRSLDYLYLAARNWRQLAWKRLIPNRVGLLLKKGELFKVRNPRLTAQCLMNAISLLEKYLLDTRQIRPLAVRLWNRVRYPADFNRQAYFTNFYDWNIRGLRLKIKQLKELLKRYKNDRDTSLVSLLTGLPVLYIHTKNHSDVHVNIVRPIITYSSDRRKWSLLNTKGLLLWKSKYYRNFIMLPDEKLPRYIRIVIERTHVDWDFNRYPDDITLGVMETLSPFDEKTGADFESVDYRLRHNRTARYEVIKRMKKELVLKLKAR